MMEKESKNAQDARVKKLWISLHYESIEPLDLEGLRAGLKKIGHPLGTAEKLLKQVFEVVDTSHDGKIEYSEFRVFVEHTEAELRRLFNSIDRDHNGRLDKAELHAAFQKADISADIEKLDKFFDHIDANHDGQITFEEWRNFLMFLPLDAPDLTEVLSYYETFSVVSSEGDVSVQEANAGLGTKPILYALFGSLFDLVQLRPSSYPQPHFDPSSPDTPGNSISDRRDIPWDPGEEPAAQFPISRDQLQTASPTSSKASVSSTPTGLIENTTNSILRLLDSASNKAFSGSPKPIMPPSSAAPTSTTSSKSPVAGILPQEESKPKGSFSAALVPSTTAAKTSSVAQPASTSHTLASSTIASSQKSDAKHKLTDLLPDPGYFISGGVAGFMSRTATAPLDRLKVYLIAKVGAKDEASQAFKSSSPIRALRAAIQPLKGACLELWKMGGIRSLFAGNGLNVLKVMPESAIKFGSYEAAKRFAARMEGHDNTRNLSAVSQFMAAGAGGVISQFAVYPLDTLKFRVQCETVAGGPRGNALILQTARKMFAEGTIRSYYRGLFLGLGGMFPYSAIDLTTYEYLRKRVTAYRVHKNKCSEKAAEPGRLLTGAIGAASSSFGATAVYPINLIRTRIQSQGTAIHRPTYTGWRDCFDKTIKAEGWRGLYKGLTPNLLKVVPSMSISYMVYETSKKVMGLK